jgi:hypothetical protein
MSPSSEKDFEKAAHRRAYEDQQLRQQLTEERRRQWDASRKKEMERLSETEKRQNENRRLDIDKEKSKLEKPQPRLSRGSRRGIRPDLPAKIVERRYGKELTKIRENAENEREEILRDQGISREQFAAERSALGRLKAQKKLDREKTEFDKDRGRER